AATNLLVTLSLHDALPISKTLIYSRLALDGHLIRSFKAFDTIRIGELEIYAFPKAHDAIDPHSFLVSSNGVNIGVFTDIGEVCRSEEHTSELQSRENLVCR